MTSMDGVSDDDDSYDSDFGQVALTTQTQQAPVLAGINAKLVLMIAGLLILLYVMRGKGK